MVPDRAQWPEILARAFADAHWRRPDSVFIKTEARAQIATPSSSHTMFNNIRLAVLSGDDPDAEIRATIAPYADRGAQLAWVTGPSCRPVDLPARLEAHGMVPEGESWGMAMPTAGFEGHVPDEVIARQISLDAVDDFVHASQRGWGVHPSSDAAFRGDVVRALVDHPESLSAYLATVNGEAAGAALTRTFPQCGLLQGASVMPTHRGRGLYQALLTRRVHDLADAGRPLAAVVASASTSGPVCEHLGFERVCTFQGFKLAQPETP